MAWRFTDEATEFSETLLSRLSNLSDTAIVPALWLYEVVNVTELAVRKGRITDEKTRDFLERLADLPVEIENPRRTQMFMSVRALVGQYNLTAYDASYLELAIHHKLPIAAFDNALAKAAKAAGFNLVQLSQTQAPGSQLRKINK
jgi:predicted nucleic acid-binding protein